MTALCCEGVGALFCGAPVPDAGWQRGCISRSFIRFQPLQRGFDLMGALEPFSSLTHFSGDALVNAVVMR
jgi:hypothetical protein